MADNGGFPDKNNILASGTLFANLVTGDFDFIDVSLNSSPTLTAGTSYWIMIAAESLNNSNYWVWSDDTLQSYTRGSPAFSSNWQAHNPVWTAIAGDLGFKTWMGGVATRIEMENGSRVSQSRKRKK